MAGFHGGRHGHPAVPGHLPDRCPRGRGRTVRWFRESFTGGLAASDGVTWTPVVLPGLGSGSAGVGGLAWTPAGFAMSIDQYPKGKPVGSIWVSKDGVEWSRAIGVPQGPLGAVGTAGDAAIVFGVASEWRSLDGAGWQMTPVKTFKGYYVAAVTALSSGDLLAAGTRFTGTPGMATWIGTPAAGETP